MADIKQRIEQDLKQAILSGDKLKVDTLKMLKSTILNEEISQGKRESGLSDDEVTTCLKRESKKRKEAAEMYRSNGAEDRAEKEEQEHKLIQEYLPEQLSSDELEKVVAKVIDENGGEVTPKTMGIIISKVRAEVGSSADGGDIAKLVKQRISN